jgi:hypothetical protein
VEYWARAQQSGLDDYHTLRPAPATQTRQAESA